MIPQSRVLLSKPTSDDYKRVRIHLNSFESKKNLTPFQVYCILNGGIGKHSHVKSP